MAGSTLKLIGLILPLGLDTLGVSLALGLAGLSPRLRLRLSFLFAGFEAAMPLIGVALGAPLGRSLGGVADYFAAGLVAALGVYMLAAGDDHGQEGERLLSMTQRGMVGAVALGVSISLDELAIGFSAGLLRLPILAMVIAVGLQAFIVTQIGVRLGSRVGPDTREAAEKLAGVALLGLGAWLLIEKLAA
ncbi:MAG: manganese efflux pump MntP family protein [Actinomycetota bacterium]|nr:manganese efflux pump MntP family protein [Actinomycetota bacterium]